MATKDLFTLAPPTDADVHDPHPFAAHKRTEKIMRRLIADGHVVVPVYQKGTGYLDHLIVSAAPPLNGSHWEGHEHDQG